MEFFHLGRRDEVALENAEQHSAEMETKISDIEGKIDPLRQMVHEMRNQETWRL